MSPLFMRILLLSLLQYAVVSGDKIVEDCPANKACLVFGVSKCRIGGARVAKWEQRGYVYEDQSSCRDEKDDPPFVYSSDLRTRLDFEPTNDKQWSFVLKYCSGDDGKKTKISEISFDFGNAKFKFTNDKKMDFYWKGKDEEWDAEGKSKHTSQHDIKFSGNLRSKDTFFTEYTFTIKTTDIKNLFDLLAKKQITMIKKVKGKDGTTEDDKYELNDERFRELVGGVGTCNPAHLQLKCHGGCDELVFPNNTNTAHCDSTFWYHPANEAKFMREWKVADKVRCTVGNWYGRSEGHDQLLTSDYEVQCAADMPARMTDLMKGLLGLGVATGLVALAVAGFFCFKCLQKRKHKHRHHSDAQTPGGSSKASGRTPGMSPGGSSKASGRLY